MYIQVTYYLLKVITQTTMNSSLWNGCTKVETDCQQSKECVPWLFGWQQINVTGQAVRTGKVNQAILTVLLGARSLHSQLYCLRMDALKSETNTRESAVTGRGGGTPLYTRSLTWAKRPAKGVKYNLLPVAQVPALHKVYRCVCCCY